MGIVKRLVCRLFGHQWQVELYSVAQSYRRGALTVVKRVCDRCEAYDEAHIDWHKEEARVTRE